jgi:hypothetical protein
MEAPLAHDSPMVKKQHLGHNARVCNWTPAARCATSVVRRTSQSTDCVSSEWCPEPESNRHNLAVSGF